MYNLNSKRRFKKSIALSMTAALVFTSIAGQAKASKKKLYRAYS